MRYLLTLVYFFCVTSQLLAQTGLPRAFDFVNLSPSARVTALGGIQVTESAPDSIAMLTPSLWLVNPASNREKNGQHVSLSYQPYYADVDMATLSYSRSLDEQGSWGLAVQFLSYGELDSYDLTGQSLGTFSSQEYAFVFNRSHQMGPFRLGLNAKYVASALGGYQASALLFDLGGTYQHPNKDLSISLSFSHIGLLLNDYTSFTKSRLPADLRLGVAFKPRYMPFRFYLTAYRWLNQTDAYFTNNNEMPGYVNKVLRHLNLGGELILGNNFSFLIGYNHLRSNTLQLEEFRGGAGLSFGLSLRLRSMQLDFSRTIYHVVGGVSHFTLTADLDKIILKR